MLYESGILQQVEAKNKGKIVAIDIETGAFEVDGNVVPATNYLFKRYPDPQPLVIHIGHRTVYHSEIRDLEKMTMPRVANQRCKGILTLVFENTSRLIQTA